jgi:hypothetical protein
LYAVRTDTPGGQGGVLDPPAALAHPRYQKHSTVHRHARIVMDVDPRLQLRVGRLHNPSLAAPPRMNNLHSNDS